LLNTSAIQFAQNSAHNGVNAYAKREMRFRIPTESQWLCQNLHMPHCL